MPIKFVFLTTDILLYILVITILIFCIWARKQEHLRLAWHQVISSKLAIISMIVLSFYILTGLLDSIHFRVALPTTTNHQIHYSGQVKSLLDVILSPLGEHDEKTYSAPFATHLYAKETIELANGQRIRDYPKLIYGGVDLKRLNRTVREDITIRIFVGLIKGIIIWFFFIAFFILISYLKSKSITSSVKTLFGFQGEIPWRTFIITLGIMIVLISIALTLSKSYHIFGTDKVGQDVFYEAIKSIRTGLIIGTLTTLVMLPFALMLGTMAGYFGGVIDDVIQYLYTTLSSIPGVLLIAASILALQIFISNHPEMFPTITERADARLLALCIILGITSWTSLCRLLRAETLKIREMDYVQAARSLGVRHFKTITKHILPNVMHIVLISVVLDFSGLVLAEAILSYVGVGVDPTMNSWGNMINSARLELAREPIVWWPLLAAFVFMFALVLFANLFSDVVRDAFDPRLKGKGLTA